MATLHRRKLVSGRVVWEITHGTGADRRRFTAGNSREEALQVLRQFEEQIALHGKAPSDNSVAAVLGQYLEFLKANRRPATFRRYERVLRTFYRNFLSVHHPGVEQLRQIKPPHLEDYKARRSDGTLQEAEDEIHARRDAELRQHLAARPKASRPAENAKFGWLGRQRFRSSVTARTVNYELQVLRTFLRWAVRRNFIFVNPATEVEGFRISKRALPKFLTREQLARVFAVCDDVERRLFMTLLLTGMRKGEVEHLTWSDINFELGVIFIQEKPEWGWKPKTDERVIPISPTLREILQRHNSERRSDTLVFPNKEGHLDIHILQKFQKVCRRAGLPKATVHSLRHSFGAHLRMAGVSLADIADLLGHKDLATTQIYAKVHQEHLRAVIAKLNPVVEPHGLSALPSPDAEPARPIRGLLGK